MPLKKGKKKGYDVYAHQSFKLLFIVFSIFLLLLIYLETGHKNFFEHKILSVESISNSDLEDLKITFLEENQEPFEIREEPSNTDYPMEVDKEIEELMIKILKELE